MKILIAGDGKVGATLTRQLSSEGYDITLIDSDPKVLENSVGHYDIMTVEGNCASMDVLLQAGVREADLLIAATSADEVNLLCCMTAHGINPKMHTIARIRNPEYTAQIYRMRDVFALSLAVNPEKQAATEVGRLLRFPGFLKRDTFAKGRAEIVELRVDAGSPLKDTSLFDLQKIVKCRVLVCVVLREGKALIPSGNFVLREGDRIFVTAPSDVLAVLLKNLGVITHKVKRVMLCGGGRLSFYLAQDLQREGMNVTLIEQDHDRCVELAELLPRVNVIHGDASKQELLDSQGLDDCDALITLTGLDELNMIISLYGKNKGVPQVITKLSRSENSILLDALQLGSVVSPKDLCCNTIVRYVRAMQNQTGAALTVHLIADGQVEAVEFRVDNKTRNCGVPLRDIRLRKNVLLTCIGHGPRIEVPNGDSSFQVGDTVIVVSGDDVPIYQLNDIFE